MASLEFSIVPGFLNDSEGTKLYEIAKTLVGDSVVVELGSWKGKSTVAIAQGLKAGKIYCVDTFDNVNMINPTLTGSTFEDFQLNTQKYKDKIHTIVTDTHSASTTWQLPIDMLFIDSDHSKPGVLQVIRDWTPHLKEEAWLLFHDYGVRNSQYGANVFEVAEAIIESRINAFLTDTFLTGAVFGGKFHKSAAA
jgi:predicted O-methyltransferase YrrM